MHSDEFPSISKPQSGTDPIAERIGQIGASLEKESWLPISFRGMLATELPQLRKLARHKGQVWRRKLAKQVLGLAMASWVCGLSPLESETISQLRALDLELSALEYSQDGSFETDSAKTNSEED